MQGFREACDDGILIGHKIENIRCVLLDGQHHQVDSSDLAFMLCSKYAFREAFIKSNPVILEPIMDVSLTSPSEFQGSVIALVNKRKGNINNSEVDNDTLNVSASVSLNNMFGFATDIRSITQGKGEFSMTYMEHSPVLPNVQEQLISNYQKERAAKQAK